MTIPTRRSLFQAATGLALANMTGAVATGAAAFIPGDRAAVADPFALGVASGEPAGTSVTLWTRLVGPLARPLEQPAARAFWEVAEDAEFRVIIRRGERRAVAGLGHSVRVDVPGLTPGRPYWYRFHAMGATSPAGRTATLPERTDRLRLALTSCQHWEQGYFSAYDDIVAREPDLILQVGDYIYEKSFGEGPDVRSFGADDPHTLDDYRTRHALYKTDRHLQAAHAAAPWAISLDDHEVENDFAGTQGGATADPVAFIRRRAAAFQAYFEHMPLSARTFDRDGSLALNRIIDIGDLARIHLLDTRQHRSSQPCSSPGVRGAGLVAPCEALQDPDRTMLGAAQEKWLLDGLARAQPVWTLIAQQTMFAPLGIGSSEPGASIWSDLWDGYPRSRTAITEAMARNSIRNAVILSGDVHSCWVNDVNRNAADPSSPKVATEIVTTCLASRNAPESLFANARRDNRHVRFMDNAHSGYVLLDLDRKRLTARFRTVKDLTDDTAACETLATFEIEDRTVVRT